MSAVQVAAYAKVNLSLEVLGKRADGFHEVRSVMQSISLADELVMEDASRLTVECELPELAGEGNLVMAAAQALRDRMPKRCGAKITLRKGIPVASGLGGASSDAAAALIGLARLWGLALPGGDVAAIAASLGSDVPFFLIGGTAMVRGRGELVEPLPDAQPLWLALLVPGHTLAAKTAALYQRLSAGAWSSGEQTDCLAEAISGQRKLYDGLLSNAFETVAGDVFPAIAAYQEALQDAGASAVHLSGAGPALFSLFDSEASAASVARRVALKGFKPFVARSLAAVEACPVARE